MNKKILIGSIIAVVILVIVSFTNVVGYMNVKSDLKIISPLFKVRNNRGEVSSNYLGKGDESNLLIPTRNERSILIREYIIKISKMSNEEYELCIQLITQKANVIGLDVDEKIVRDALNIIRELNPQTINKYSKFVKNIPQENDITASPYITLCDPYPRCIIYGILTLIYAIIYEIHFRLTIKLNCFDTICCGSATL